MYLRDSQNQVLPYFRFAKAEMDGIGLFLRGLLRRHIRSVLLDPFANAFDFFEDKAVEEYCNSGAWTRDKTTELAPNGTRVDGMKVCVGVFIRGSGGGSGGGGRRGCLRLICGWFLWVNSSSSCMNLCGCSCNTTIHK